MCRCDLPERYVVQVAVLVLRRGGALVALYCLARLRAYERNTALAEEEEDTIRVTLGVLVDDLGRDGDVNALRGEG